MKDICYGRNNITYFTAEFEYEIKMDAYIYIAILL